MRAAYNGHEALTFTDYLDLESGKTLHAEPGGVYDIAPASGRVAAEVPEPWFTAVEPGGQDGQDGDGTPGGTPDDSEGAGTPAGGDEAPPPSGQ